MSGYVVNDYHKAILKAGQHQEERITAIRGAYTMASNAAGNDAAKHKAAEAERDAALEASYTRYVADRTAIHDLAGTVFETMEEAKATIAACPVPPDVAGLMSVQYDGNTANAPGLYVRAAGIGRRTFGP
jgi:hypothetical protein